MQNFQATLQMRDAARRQHQLVDILQSYLSKALYLMNRESSAASRGEASENRKMLLHRHGKGEALQHERQDDDETLQT